MLILASTSPYRKELLSRLKLPFTTLSPDIDETPWQGESAQATAQRLAEQKATRIAQAHPEAVVIGSDQVACLSNHPLETTHLGKPGNRETAFKQLQMMRGQLIIFHTAVSVICLAKHIALHDNVPTLVQVRNLPDETLMRYLTLEPAFDCAGSAKVEGLGISLMERVESKDPTALIGLPLISLNRMLEQVGLSSIHG